MQKKWIRLALAVIAVPVVTISAYHMVRAYEDGTAFTPSASGRELQTNQVVFSGEEDTTARKSGAERDGESELWEKDREAQDTLRPEVKRAADYLFQTGRTDMPEGTDTINLAGDETGNAPMLPEEVSQEDTQDPGNDNFVYDIVQNPEKADDVIAGGQGGSAGDTAGGSGSNSSTPEPTTSPIPILPTPTPVPAPTQAPVPTATPQPTVRPSDTIKDPTPAKPGNNNPYFEDHDYEENSKWTDDDVLIAASLATDNFYRGQQLTEYDIFSVLEAGIMINVDSGSGILARRYLWGQEDYGRYIRVDAVSFDGGDTWIKAEDFPVRIPMDAMDEVLIKLSYRLKPEEAWREYWDKYNDAPYVTYSVKDSKIYVLSRQLTEEDTEIPEDCIINILNNMYPQPGTYYNLYRIQENYINATFDNTWAMEQLFSGWTENGEPVDWFYEVTPGRHIIEPGELIPVQEGYAVWLQNFQMNGEVCPLQTLYSWTDDTLNGDGDLEIQEGIQAVVPAGYWDIPTVDKLVVPSSVIYIDTSSLIAKEGYQVSEDNPEYASTEDGWLLNKAETELLSVPSTVTEITLPETIQKVDLSVFCNVQKITLTAESSDQLPEIVTDNLFYCEVIVPENLISEFYKINPIEYSEDQNLVVISDQGVEYILENGKVVSENGELRWVQPSNSKSIGLTDAVTSIHEGALQRSDDESISTKMLILSESGSLVTLEKGCFTDSDITTIQCYTGAQAADITRQLKEQGITDITVQTLAQSKEGFRYTTMEEDGIETTLLLKAPADITIFEDGSVTAEDGSKIEVNAIGDNAFSKCQQLEWVILPESVNSIGYEAFYGCSALQGILINTGDSIMIGDRSMDNCSSLRFVASNAMYAERVADYDPEITDANTPYGQQKQLYFYTLADSVGYGSNSLYFGDSEDEASCVRRYTLVDLDDTGRSKVLYAANDAAGDWMAIRSGSIVPEQLELPVTTVEIFEHALAGTVSEADSGAYTLNWPELTALQFVDAFAFWQSGLSGKVRFAEDLPYILGQQAFAGCAGITEVELPGEAADLKQAIFAGCSGLKKITFGVMWTNVGIYSGTFDDCDSLTDIYFTYGVVPLAFASYSKGFGFYFNTVKYDEGLRVHVPEYLETDYIKKWRYMFAGYAATTSQPAYLEMWQDIQFANLDWDTWEYPADEVVDALLKEQLLMAENRLRDMLGVEEATEPVDFYPYRVDEDGYITLLGAPSDATVIMLDAATLEMPDGWCLDYVGADAFSNSKNLQWVIFPDNFSGIYSNAFRGVESDSLVLIFEGLSPDMTPPALSGGTDEEPFTFGIDMDKVTIIVPTGMEELYYEAWKDYGVTIDGYIPPEDTSVSDGDAAGTGEEQTDAGISEGDAGSVSSGDADTVSGGDAGTERIQEEAVQ